MRVGAKAGRALDHVLAVSAGAANVPVGEVPVETGRSVEHALQGGGGADVPAGEVAVEGGYSARAGAKPRLNTMFMRVTWLTSHIEMSLLKLVACMNVPCISVTAETSQQEMSSSKFCLSQNMPYKLVTLETSQSLMPADAQLPAVWQALTAAESSPELAHTPPLQADAARQHKTSWNAHASATLSRRSRTAS